MQIANLDRVLHDLIAHRVGLAVAHAWLNPAAGHPDGERARIVVPADKLHHLTVAIFPHGRASEFAAPDYQRVLQHAAFLQVGQKRRNGLIGFAAAVREADIQGIFGDLFRERPSPSDRAE